MDIPNKSGHDKKKIKLFNHEEHEVRKEARRKK